jgi:Integrase core domain
MPDNGQVERMNRTIKEATVQRYHHDDHEQLRRHLEQFVSAPNFGRQLKTLNGLTPYEFAAGSGKTIQFGSPHTRYTKCRH